jgi:hypothetical protein
VQSDKLKRILNHISRRFVDVKINKCGCIIPCHLHVAWELPHRAFNAFDSTRFGKPLIDSSVVVIVVV